MSGADENKAWAMLARHQYAHELNTAIRALNVLVVLVFPGERAAGILESAGAAYREAES